MKTVPDKCPFCESPMLIHGGNPLRSEDGGFATYECKTSQDAKWDNDQFIRVGQSDVCRFREVIILKKQRDEARERIKRLEKVGDKLYSANYCGCLMDGPCKTCSDAANLWDEIKEAKP